MNITYHKYVLDYIKNYNPNKNTKLTFTLNNE